MKKTILWSLGAYAIFLALLAWWINSDSNPGIDPSLNGKTLDELVQVLGMPESEVHLALDGVRDEGARRAFLTIPDRGSADSGKVILEAKWVRSDPDLPTALETAVWLREIDGRWVAFHNYRRYLWAGL
jgi:hypothetical protein